MLLFVLTYLVYVATVIIWMDDFDKFLKGIEEIHLACNLCLAIIFVLF